MANRILSPFQYPGGKSWFIRYARTWLKSQPRKPGLLVEPFAGGAHVGLTAAAEGLVEHVLLNELDKRVAAVWQTIFNGNAEWLARKIETFNMTEENTVELLFNTQPFTTEELAFHTIINNRAGYGGVMYEGAHIRRKLRHGRAILHRWYPGTLAKRIRTIAEYRDRITFQNGDAFDVFAQYGDREDAVWFIDPPYIGVGARLYLHSSVDYADLVLRAGRLAGDFLVTLNNVDEARRLAEQNGLAQYVMQAKNVNNVWKGELILGRDLSWLTP